MTTSTPSFPSPVETATAVLPPTINEPPLLTSSPFPTLEPIICTDDTCLNASLQRIENTIPQTEYEPLVGSYAENEIDLNLVYYDVKDGQLGEPQFLHVPDSFQVYQQDTAA